MNMTVDELVFGDFNVLVTEYVASLRPPQRAGELHGQVAVEEAL